MQNVTADLIGVDYLRQGRYVIPDVYLFVGLFGFWMQDRIEGFFTIAR